MERSLFSRDLLSLVGKGEHAPAPALAPEQRRDEMEEDKVNLTLALSLGSGIDDKKGDNKIPRSSSAAALTTPAEVPALPRTSSNSMSPVQAEDRAPRLPASESPSPSSACLEGDAHKLQGTLKSTSSLPAVTEAAGNGEPNKRKDEQGLTKRLEAKKKMMIERKNSICSSSKEAPGQVVPQDMNANNGKLESCDDEAVVGSDENQSSGMDPTPKWPRGHPPKYQAALTSQHSLSAAGKKPNPAYKGTAVTMEPRSSSSVPSFFNEAIRRVTAASPPPPSSLAPIRTAAAAAAAAATLGSSSRGDQTILGRAAATRANSTLDDLGRRLMQEMPAVHTKDLPNGNRVSGFLYKYRKADDVKIVCICHGSFFTPSEFLEHAGAGNGEIVNPLRHIVVSPNPTLQ